jgi:hypothetical protein
MWCTEGLAPDYGRAVGGSSCSWVEPDERTIYIVCSAGRTNSELIETAASRMCYTQSWVCIVVELKSRELAGWMAYKKM